MIMMMIPNIPSKQSFKNDYAIMTVTIIACKIEMLTADNTAVQFIR